MASAALALLAIGCGTHKPEGAGPISHLHYITFGPGVTGLVAQVKKPTITACLSGVGGGEVQEWTDKISSSILKWVDTMRALTSDKLTSSVEVSVSGGNCDTDIVVQAGTWSNTSIGQYPTVRMADTGYFASYNVLLHEFGHAFALSDTYQNSQSGNCIPGQPQAVMCNTSFDAPQSDDVKGMAEIFRNEFPSDEPPTEPPPPPNPPPPPAEPELKHQLFAALGLAAADGSYALKVGLSGDVEAPGGKLEVCRGSKTVCTGSSGSWTEASREAEKADAVIFGAGSIAPVNAMQLTIRYKLGDRAVYRTIELQG